jgi:hypothetical protein
MEEQQHIALCLGRAGIHLVRPPALGNDYPVSEWLGQGDGIIRLCPFTTISSCPASRNGCSATQGVADRPRLVPSGDDNGELHPERAERE